MENEVRKGRNIILMIAGMIIVIEIILAILKIILGQPITISESIRWLLTIILIYLLYRGYRWSRITMAILNTIAFFAMGMIPFFIFPIWSMRSPSLIIVLYWIFTLLATISMGVSAGFLVFSKHIGAFQLYQRSIGSQELIE